MMFCLVVGSQLAWFVISKISVCDMIFQENSDLSNGVGVMWLENRKWQFANNLEGNGKPIPHPPCSPDL